MLFWIPVGLFVIFLYKVVQSEKAIRLARRVSSNRLRSTERNLTRWQGEHPHGLPSDPDRQILLQEQVGALMLWLSAHEDWNETRLASRRQQLETLVELLDPADKH
jgi:hypothetical protein